MSECKVWLHIEIHDNGDLKFNSNSSNVVTLSGMLGMAQGAIYNSKRDNQNRILQVPPGTRLGGNGQG